MFTCWFNPPCCKCLRAGLIHHAVNVYVFLWCFQKGKTWRRLVRVCWFTWPPCTACPASGWRSEFSFHGNHTPMSPFIKCHIWVVSQPVLINMSKMLLYQHVTVQLFRYVVKILMMFWLDDIMLYCTHFDWSLVQLLFMQIFQYDIGSVPLCQFSI